MSCKKGGKSKRHFLLAKLVTESDKSAPCAFCNRDVDDEIIYGKLYSIGDIQCHYFCVLLSCCLVQKGKDEEGLFGFLYPDIIAEIERSKKHKCSYCGRDGATLGCSVSQCRKQFHLPCGRERNAVSLFYGNFKSFCEKHAPRQRLNDEIMAKVKVRKSQRKKLSPPKSLEIAANNMSSLNISDGGNENPPCVEAEPNQEVEAVCVICHEKVDGYPTLNTFWPPCCARDAWFHRNCLQRMALSAGMHYLKCPLCNQKEAFYEAVLSQGYYVPDRDAAWELEQNAFAEIYERPVTCSATECACPMGRDYDAETGAWDIKLCILCGSSGVHAQCAQAAAGGDGSGGNGGNGGNSGSDGNGGGWETYLRHVCATCAPAAPVDLDKLVVSINTAEAPAAGAAPGSARGRPMPCRMSLRRTKQRALRHQRAAGSESMHGVPPIRVDRVDQDTESSRLELNLKPPKKPDKGLIEPSLLRNVENKLLSPLKLLERGLYERISEADVKDFELDPDELIAQMRERLTKPKPLVEKKKIVNDILESVLESLHRNKKKTKEPLKEWNSPKKCLEIEVEDVEASPIQCNQPTADQTEDAQELKKDYNNPPIAVKEEPEPEEAVPETSDHPPKVEGGFQPMETEEKEYKENVEVTEEKGHQESEKVEEFGNSKGISNSLPDFGSPRKVKPVHVQDSSMEISEHDHAVSIALVQTEPLERSARSSIATSSPMKARTLFKLSPVDGVLSNKLDIDVESFKCRYLDEVGGQYEASAGEEGRGTTKRKLLEGGVEADAGKRQKGRRQRAGAAPTLGRDAAKGRRRQERRLRLVVKCALVRKRLVQTTIQSFFRPSR